VRIWVISSSVKYFKFPRRIEESYPERRLKKGKGGQAIFAKGETVTKYDIGVVNAASGIGLNVRDPHSEIHCKMLGINTVKPTADADKPTSIVNVIQRWLR